MQNVIRHLLLCTFLPAGWHIVSCVEQGGYAWVEHNGCDFCAMALVTLETDPPYVPPPYTPPPPYTSPPPYTPPPYVPPQPPTPIPIGNVIIAIGVVGVIGLFGAIWWTGDYLHHRKIRRDSYLKNRVKCRTSEKIWEVLIYNIFLYFNTVKT